MKNKIYLLLMILSFGLLSCEKDEPGGTATENVAGEWFVAVDAVLSDGTIISSAELTEEGIWFAEKGIIRTYNTAANVPDKMYISDMAVFGGAAKGDASSISNYLAFRVPIDINQSTGEFSTSNGDFVQNLEVNYKYDPKTWDESEKYANIKILNGKITKDGGKQNNGTVDDIIEFDLYIDDKGYILFDDFDHYHVQGIRYSGLVENH